MTLSAPIKEGGLADTMTATPATPATHQPDAPATVTPAATVAVAERPEPFPELTPDKESNIRAWRAYIEETDSIIVAEAVDKCRYDLEARRCFQKRSEEGKEPTTVNRPAYCGDRIYFERIDHPELGHCVKGEPEAIAGLRDTDSGDTVNAFCHGQGNPTTAIHDRRGPKHKGEFPK